VDVSVLQMSTKNNISILNFNPILLIEFFQFLINQTLKQK
jgi:hypothetical protein